MAISCNPQDLINAARCFFCVKSSARQAVKTYLWCQAQGSAAFSPFGLVTANAWALRVVANGGAMPSQNSINAVATFADTLNRAGVWSKLLDVNIFAPDSLIACLTPVLVTDGSNLWTNNNFVAGDLSTTGLVGSAGLGKFLNTGIDPNARFKGPAATVFGGLSFYVSATPADGNWCEISWIQNNWSLYDGFGGTCFYDCYSTILGGRISAANANYTGFLSGNRTSTTDFAVYKAKSTVPFATLASSNANASQMAVNAGKHIFVFANNNGADTALQVSSRTLSFAAYHFGLSAADCQTLFNAVQAIRVALGGGFV